MEQSPQSPNAMAEAAYTAAVAHMEHMQETHEPLKEFASDAANSSPSREGVHCSRQGKKLKLNGDGAFSDSPLTDDSERDAGERIKDIWKSGATTNKVEAKFAETLRLLVGELDSLAQCGLEAFYSLDTTERELVQSKELAETRSRECQRLSAIDEQSRASLSVSISEHTWDSTK